MQQVCANCGISFEITDEDRKFYEKIKVPEPTWCPPCREMRRMAWCNEGVLYKRKCDLCRKDVISEYAPTNPRIAYCVPCWWTDWDRMGYGRDVDFGRSILDQIFELKDSMPHQHVCTDLTNENSDYTHHAGNQKNCYMMFHTSFAKDCYYGYGVKKTESCVDNHYCHESQFCYECIDVQGCYNLAWSQDCSNCSDGMFLLDCIGCKNCLLCTGLRNKEYCVLNQQMTKEEYQGRRNDINQGSYGSVQATLKIFRDLQLKYPRKYCHREMAEDSTGDHLYKAREVYHCFDCSNIEYSKYCSQLQLGTKYCYDIYQFGINIELCYDCSMIGYNIYNCQFCFDLLEQCSDLLYCMRCHSTQNCFGCFGLVKSKYCILNKQYSEQEYKSLLPKILEKMKADGEFGEHPQIARSPNAYNETTAQMWYPKTKGEVEAKGWRWEDRLPFTTGQETIKKIPDTINDVPDTITEEILACEKCKRNYKITPQELQFYRTHNYPLPHECFQCRKLRRMQTRNPRRFWQRQCAKCSKEIQTTYAPERPEIVYCEECYLREIY